MLTRNVVVTCILALMLPVVGFAQGFAQGDRVFTLMGSGTSDDDLDNNLFSVAGAFSYFFTDRIEGAIRQTITYADIEDADNNWNASTRVAADYNFDSGRLWPFVGGSFGYI